LHSLDELVSVIDRLIARIDELEARVSALEHPPVENVAADATERTMKQEQLVVRTPLAGDPLKVAAAAAPARAATVAPEHPIEQLLAQPGGGVASVVGKVFLGVAGAYVLRALAESGVVPQFAIVSVALAYAGMWLFWAARMDAQRRFAAAAYAATSALIGSPMLWELTLRFKVLPDTLTALLLVAFVATASALAWKRNLTAISWVAGFSASITAFGLLVATRDPVPFALALVAVALLSESAACFGRCVNLRAFVAVALDLASAVVIVIYTAGPPAPAEYKVLSHGLLLALIVAPLAIYGVSTALWSVVLLRRISVIQVLQTTLAFVIAIFGIQRGTHEAWTPATGVFCLAAALACYLAVFTRFSQPGQRREYHVYSSWGAALLVAGNWLLFSPHTIALVLSVLAVCAAWAGVRWNRDTLEFHAIAYLAAAAIASGLFVFAADALFTGVPGTPSWTITATAFLVLACFAAAWKLAGDQWQHRLLRLLLAAQAMLVLTAFAVLAILLLIWNGAPANAARLGVVRTLVICAVALGLGFTGSRSNRIELVWTAYGAMALCTLKLLFEDLRTGSTGSMAVSLFLYGMVWLLLPKLVRSGARKPAQGSAA
jgi:hypothetical protein